MTAPEGKDYWEKEHIGCLFIYSGEKTAPALGRQGRGVALVLGPQMGRAFRASGSKVVSSGPRHLLIEFRLHGKRWVLGSAYGPSGDTPADQVERENLFATLGSAVGGAADNKVLLIGIDANVSVGPDASSAAVSFDDKRSWRAYRKPCGKFGLKRGKKLKRDTFLGFLRSQEWCLANTFFPGPSASVEPLGTWLGVDPKRRVWHQLDYWIVNHRLTEHGWNVYDIVEKTIAMLWTPITLRSASRCVCDGLGIWRRPGGRILAAMRP